MFRRTTSLRTVVVVTKGSVTLKGALVDERRNALVLRAVKVANIGEAGRVTWTGVDGDVVVPMENVEYWQDGLDAEILT